MATLESMPTKTMMKVSAHGGATLTSLRISAAIRPASSATPTPIIATKMTATTLKLAKLVTNEVKMNRMPSIVSRLLIAVVSLCDLEVVVVVVLGRDVQRGHLRAAR